MDPKPTYDELLALVGELRTALKVAHQRLEHLTNEVARLKRYGATAPSDEGQGLLSFADASAPVRPTTTT